MERSKKSPFAAYGIAVADPGVGGGRGDHPPL